jgi:hypothetical protein
VELQLLKQKMTLHFLVAEEQRINLQTPLLIISLECYRPQRRGEKLYQNVYICTLDINVHIMYVISVVVANSRKIVCRLWVNFVVPWNEKMVFFMATWILLRQSGTYILRSFGNLVAIWYTFARFGIFSPILVYQIKRENLATLVCGSFGKFT